VSSIVLHIYICIWFRASSLESGNKPGSWVAGLGRTPYMLGAGGALSDRHLPLSLPSAWAKESGCWELCRSRVSLPSNCRELRGNSISMCARVPRRRRSVVHLAPCTASCQMIATAAPRMHVKVERTVCLFGLPGVGRQLVERDWDRVSC
jgi:hypothetical protein